MPDPVSPANPKKPPAGAAQAAKAQAPSPPPAEQPERSSEADASALEALRAQLEAALSRADRAEARVVESDALRAEAEALRAEDEKLLQSYRETVAKAEENFTRLSDGVRGMVPRYEWLVERDGKDPAEALRLIEEAVKGASDYLATVKQKLPRDIQPQLSRQQRGPYVVLAPKQVQIHGGITTIPEGTIVSLQSYGAQGIARLREQGVKMALLSDEECKARGL